MKTKEELQAAVNDIRRACEAHGVVLIAYEGIARGAEIRLHDVADLAEKPNPLYNYNYYHATGSANVLKQMNKVRLVPYTTNSEGEDPEHFALAGIGDVEGHTKPLIVVHQHLDTVGEMNVANTIDVDSLDQVEDVDFVKYWKDRPDFTHFECGVGDGPFGTLVAHGKNWMPVVVGFIEGVKPEELVKKWPSKHIKEETK